MARPVSPRSVPRQARAAETRQRILSAAESLLAEVPPSALSTKAVAREAGVPVGSVYRYFAHAEALLRALFASFNAPTIDAIAAGPSPGDWRQEVAQVFAVVRRAHDSHPAYGTLMAHLGRGEGEDAMAPLVADRLLGAAPALGAQKAGRIAGMVVAIVEGAERLSYAAPQERRAAIFAEGERAVTAYLATYLEGD